MPTNNSCNIPTGTAGTIVTATGPGGSLVLTTATYPAITTINRILYSSANNTVGQITAGNNGVLISSATGVPNWLANGTPGQVLTANSGSPPSWQGNANGDVSGPSSATDNAIARFDGTTGKLIQNSVVTVSDTGDMAGVVGLSATSGTFSGLTSNRMVMTTTGGLLQTPSALTNGQLYIGSTGVQPVAASLTQPAAGLTITGGAGSVTFALANDLAAVEGLSSTGLATRTATDTWAVRTLTGTTNQIDVTNGNGVSGNPTLTLSSTATTPGYIRNNGGMTTGIANGASGSIFSYADNQQYWVMVNAPGSNPIARASAMVVSSSGFFQVSAIVSSLCSITISGSTVQITNSAGGTLAFNWSCIRVF